MPNLRDVAAIAKSSMKAGIVKNVVETSPILDQIPIETTGSLFHKFMMEGSLPQASTRNIGSDFQTQKKATFKPGDIMLKPFGGNFPLDRNLADEKGIDGKSQVIMQIDQWKRSLPLDWKRLLIKGDIASNSGDIDGLEGIVVKLPDTQRINFAGQAAGKTIATATNQEIVDSINRLIDTNVGAGDTTFLACNRLVLNAIYAKLKGTAPNDPLAKVFQFRKIGMPGVGGAEMKVRVGLWEDDLPIFPIDYDSQKIQIITQNEPAGDGSGNTFSSMYAVVAGEDTLLQLQKYEDGPQISVVPTSTGADYYIEWPIALLKLHDNAVGVMRGIAL